MQRDAANAPGGVSAAQPRPHFPPVVLNRASRPRTSRLKVVLLNAAGGRHLREVLALLKRPPLRNADVILLCEINTGRRRTRDEIAHLLGDTLEMSCVYGAEFGLKPPDGEIASYMGNAILCSAPFEDVSAVAMHRPRTPLAWPMRMRRWVRVGTPTGMVAKVKFGGKEVAVGIAHLHSRCAPAERARQMAAYLESFPASGRAIFGGDLNTTTTELSNRELLRDAMWLMLKDPQRFRAPQQYEPLFEHLREHGLEVDGANVPNQPTFTFSGLIPKSLRPKLDWIAVRELSPIADTAAVVSPRARFTFRRVSDHDFVTVDLEL